MSDVVGPAGLHLVLQYNDLDWLTCSKTRTQFRGELHLLANHKQGGYPPQGISPAYPPQGIEVTT